MSFAAFTEAYNEAIDCQGDILNTNLYNWRKKLVRTTVNYSGDYIK